jgi:hypothetical protein
MEVFEVILKTLFICLAVLGGFRVLVVLITSENPPKYLFNGTKFLLMIKGAEWQHDWKVRVISAPSAGKQYWEFEWVHDNTRFVVSASHKVMLESLE